MTAATANTGLPKPVPTPWRQPIADYLTAEAAAGRPPQHRFATKAYRGSRNLRAVQELLGHASVTTTEIYTGVDDDELRAAMMAATDSDGSPS